MTFATNSLVLYQPDRALDVRLSSTEELADFARRLQEVCSETFAAETNPATLEVVVAIRPGRQSKVWLISSLDDDDDRLTSLRSHLEALEAPLVRQGPVAFAIEGGIAGGLRAKPLEGESYHPPMPAEWTAAAIAAGRSLVVPDGILAIVWPERPWWEGRPDNPVVLTRRLELPLFLGTSFLLYAALAFAASTIGSRDSSGVQYAFLPGLAAPFVAALGVVLVAIGWKLRVSIIVSLLPFIAAFGAWFIPETSLAKRDLEFGRWLMITIAVLHAVLVVLLVWRPGGLTGTPHPPNEEL